MAFHVTGPEGPIRFSSAMFALEFNAVENSGPVNWSVNYGSMDPPTGDMSVLSPLNLTRTLKHGGPVIVTGHDTGDDTEATFELEIEATLPVIPDYGIESDILPGFELSEPEQGEPKFRELPVTANWPLIFRSRQYLEFAGVRQFLANHETFPFWLEDMSLGELRKVFRVSALRRLSRRTNLLDYSFQVKDFEYVPPAGIADIGPWAP